MLFGAVSRASSPISDASRYTRFGSQVLPIDRSEGYDVVLVSVVALPVGVIVEALTPWLDSFHQPQAAIPSRAMAGARELFISCAFSPRVIRDTRSAARSAGR